MNKRRLNVPAILLVVIIAALAIFGIFKLIEYIMPRNEKYVVPGDHSAQQTTSDTAVEPTGSTEPENSEGAVYLKKDVVTYLVIGLDDSGHGGSSGKNQMADFISLLVVDKTDKTFSVIQFDRDTMAPVDILGIGGRKIRTVTEQLAYSHIYGSDNDMRCRNTATSVTKLIGGIKIDHYISVTMNAVPALNDYVGGVTLTLEDDEDLTSISPAWTTGSTITLVGDEALAFIRGRAGVEDETNISRMRRQRQYLEALMRMHNGNSFSYSYAEGAYNAISEYSVTDMNDARTISELVNYVSDYSYTGIFVPEGESVLGGEYMEFWIDAEKMQELINDIFYEKKRG